MAQALRGLPHARGPATLHAIGQMTALFTATVLLGASLLFLVQPMIGKRLLPQLGAAPAVWNTCLVFFQAVLAGYAYAHGAAAWLSLRRRPIGGLIRLITDRVWVARDEGSRWARRGQGRRHACPRAGLEGQGLADEATELTVSWRTGLGPAAELRLFLVSCRFWPMRCRFFSRAAARCFGVYAPSSAPGARAHAGARRCQSKGE